MIGCLIESIWTPRSKLHLLTPKTQQADTRTKGPTEGSFTRDEWNHLLRLLNLLNFSMFSCSHSSNFLSDPIRKLSATSKRGQEATSSEGSQMAKPKPMHSVMAKSKPWNLALHNPLIARKNPPQDLSIPVKLGNVEREQGGALGIRKLTRNPSQDPIEYSQVSRQENTQHADSWKQEDRDESSRLAQGNLCGR